MAKTTKKPSARKVTITAVLAALLVGLTLFLFETLNAVAGNGITIASFGATALIVVFNPRGPGASPKAILFGYVVAGLVALGLGLFVSFPAWFMTMLAVGIISAIQIATNMVHPPAVAYSLSFFYGGFGFMEFVFTLPALLSFFIALGVLVFVLEAISSLFMKDKKKKKEKIDHSVKHYIDRAIPYALVALFMSLFVEFVYKDFAASYQIVFTVFDWVIIALFAIDLYFKYQTLHNVKKFVREYWLDIIATIPVFVVLRFAEGMSLLLRLERIAVAGGAQVTSLSRLLKPVARFPRFAKLIERVENS